MIQNWFWLNSWVNGESIVAVRIKISIKQLLPTTQWGME